MRLNGSKKSSLLAGGLEQQLSGKAFREEKCNMKIYDENGKLIEGNWELCKAIVTDYDKENPFEHTKIVEDTAVEVAKKYDVSYNDVVKTVELLSGVSL